jgi:hypothetical protein
VFRRKVLVKGLGIVALAAGLAIGGLAFGRAATTSAQTLWWDPTVGMYFNFQNSVSAYPVNFPTSNEPIVSTTGVSTISTMPSVGFVAPTVSYAVTGVPSVYAPPAADWANPGGSYCAIGQDQIWIPAGASPASYGC